VILSTPSLGNDEECLQELQRCGISVTSFPITSDGNICLGNQLKTWLNEKRKEGQVDSGEPERMDLTFNEPLSSDESKSSMALKVDDDDQSDLKLVPVFSDPNTLPSTKPQKSVVQPIVTPTSNDVLMGRGRRFQNYAGNVKFRIYLQGHEAGYNSADRNGKSSIAMALVSSIKASGTRFLQRSSEMNGEELWVEIDDKEAHEKVVQCFRTARKKDILKKARDEFK
jgi:hypothetical protein